MITINTTGMVKDNEVSINGVKFMVDDETATMILNICTGQNTVSNNEPKKDPAPKKTEFNIGYHIEKTGNLFCIIKGSPDQKNGNYYKDAYQLRYIEGAKELVDGWIKALPNVKSTQRSFETKNGKIKTYNVYGYSTKAEAEKQMATLPTTNKVVEEKLPL